MVTTVFAAPYEPPTVPNPWPGMTMLWTGHDGVIWDITGGHGGLCMLPGVRGLTMPPIAHHKSRTASVPGARWRGATTLEREVFWPIQVYHDNSSTEWVARDRAFWASLQPHRTGEWAVVQPNGERRTLTLRFRDDGQAAFMTDPVRAGWANYGITLDAEQPYWAGRKATRIWKADPGSSFFTPGPPFSITSGARASTAAITNDGDVEAYPVWKLTGPITSATLGINGRFITVNFNIPTGSQLIIDTSPGQLTAVMDGVDKIPSLATSEFAPLPVGTDIPISLTLVGSGTAEMSFIPLFYRAW